MASLHLKKKSLETHLKDVLKEAITKSATSGRVGRVITWCYQKTLNPKP